MLILLEILSTPHALLQDSFLKRSKILFTAISLSHDDEYPPFLGGIQSSLTNADN
jgi:hypothetical protein